MCAHATAAITTTHQMKEDLLVNPEKHRSVSEKKTSAKTNRNSSHEKNQKSSPNHRGQTPTYENTAKHRKEPEKHPETNPANYSSKTVAIK